MTVTGVDGINLDAYTIDDGAKYSSKTLCLIYHLSRRYDPAARIEPVSLRNGWYLTEATTLSDRVVRDPAL